MVNRENYLAVQAYLQFKRDIQHRQPATIANLWARLRYLLEWADDTLLIDAGRIRPTYPAYLNTVTRGDGGGLLADKSLAATLIEAVQFLRWAKDHLPNMRAVKVDWLDTLTPVRRDRPIVNERKSVTLETVRALLVADWDDLRGRRAKATAAFLFLSGMRVTAFATMPVKAVNLAEKSVRQDPVIGVMTKLRKRATTFLLDIPDLLEVVTAWDSEVRQHAGQDDLWFHRFQGTAKTDHAATLVQMEIRELFKRAGLEPMTPHKFRHGHAEYTMKLSKDLADFKMLSQNLMHANLGITDGIYAILSQGDMQARMAALGKAAQPGTPQAAQAQSAVPDIAALIEETVKRMMQAQADQAAHDLPAEKTPRKPRKARGAE